MTFELDLIDTYTRPERPSILEDLECPRCGIVRRSPTGAPHQRMPLCSCEGKYGSDTVAMRYYKHKKATGTDDPRKIALGPSSLSHLRISGDD